MYSVALYEDGRFCTNIGDPVSTELDAVNLIRSKVNGMYFTVVAGYIGVKFDRAGTTCALLVTDQNNDPIRIRK